MLVIYLFLVTALDVLHNRWLLLHENVTYLGSLALLEQSHQVECDCELDNGIFLSQSDTVVATEVHLFTSKLLNLLEHSDENAFFPNLMIATLFY